MRYVRYLVLVLIGLCLLLIASANRGMVSLQLLPGEFVPYVGRNWQVGVPLYLVIFAAVAVGVFLGFVWEWLREHKHRKVAARSTRQAKQLSREVEKLKPTEKDEVLALIEKDKPAA
ncbi:LapA family protein [Acidimangrovimonas sediminis]|uniref:LapA family protein n=1 Tax=Acidimangrovimonas sediminis TaxID=2056283 RepID=UPI000C7FD32D|nr:LapA family protein [Acidimangrovimonas sediminis]